LLDCKLFCSLVNPDLRLLSPQPGSKGSKQALSV
jgi:hypothetical protein